VTGCYLLHFQKPISPAHTCQHYVGWAEDIQQRIAEHRAGRGARLTQVAKERGIDFAVVRVWPDTERTHERKLKNRKNAPRLCPICRQRHDIGDLFLDTITLDDVTALPF
jgi:predicted GIY-YIG superfamily endonuclease